jgi:hypothetical protein
MLNAGDLVPHFDVETVDGRRARYADVWQRRNLLLVTLGGAPSSQADAYAAALSRQADSVDGLPSAVSLLEWLEHVQQRCPECEGEAR